MPEPHFQEERLNIEGAVLVIGNCRCPGFQIQDTNFEYMSVGVMKD